jgi:energy-coupling factor transporter ATP-binding protein EcfA2
MSDVTLRNVTKRFPGVVALQDVSFSIGDGEFFVLLGPTGAGKTTTLRIIAGLEQHDSGAVLFDDEPVDDYTPADRDEAVQPLADGDQFDGVSDELPRDEGRLHPLGTHGDRVGDRDGPELDGHPAGVVDAPDGRFRHPV